MRDHPTQPTQQIVDAIRQGDRREWDRLLARVGGHVYVYVANRMGPLRQIMQPEDVLQEVFAKAFEAFDDFVGGESGSLACWMATIAKHQLQRLRRHHLDVEKRDPRREVPRDETARLDPPDSTPSPSSLVARDERVRAVADAVATLEPDLRELVLKHYYEGQPLEGIANDTGIPRTTLSSRYQRARTLLRAKLS